MKILLTIIIALVLAGGAWYWYTNYYVPVTSPSNTSAIEGSNAEPSSTGDINLTVNVEGGIEAPGSATVMLTSTGFSPQSVTIKKGGTITWVNKETGSMWVASAQHPTHTTYSGTTLQEHCDDSVDVSFDQCKNGGTYSFTFNKVGSWGYHNHLNTSQFGKVEVVE